MPEPQTPQRQLLSRRAFITAAGAAGAGFILWAALPGGRAIALAHVPRASLSAAAIPKFQTPLLIPPVMPRAGTITVPGGKPVDSYEISMRQFTQQVLPAGYPATTVWGYGAVTSAGKKGLLLHNAPSLTIEAKWDRPVRVKWINDLVDANGNALPHLLPVDPTLHWANPPGGTEGRDERPHFETTPGRYTGPVPIVTHVHGSVGVGDESDGYAEAWYLPAAKDLPAGYATEGTWYEFFAAKAAAAHGVEWGPGFATFQYPNSQRASTLWYHDHTLGMTRLNVYAGPAGFFLVRGGPDGDDAVRDARTGARAVLPGPAPKEGDRIPPNKTYYEIPIAVQDRSFNPDGSLFYPDSREFFDGIVADYLPDGEFSPIWNPEFFGETIIANGNTWPFQVVEQRRYRFRFLNGCQSRFLILDFSGIPGVRAWQIGNEGGFLAAPVDLAAYGDRLLLAPAERADLVVDFAAVPLGDHVLGNVGPDAPFGGGEPGVAFTMADPATTGQILAFRVVPAVGPDPTTPPEHLALPQIMPLPAESVVRPLALVERSAEGEDDEGEELEGPTSAVLGTLEDGVWTEREWADEVTENPAQGATEVWEFVNTTADAHPMHVHEVAFEVVGREGLVLDGDEVAVPVQPDGVVTPPEPWETGRKDTVIAYPGQVTRVRARFDRAGQYVWHCHIVEHEDNEMMRPYRIGPVQPGQPGGSDQM
ncbi:multicopper oxidase family protein [Agromyces aurantiacus]|uniref:Multicopper oxidase family protein n=1 Tax=Agromyces aurantiacus TaxID=165814 RepID=A0ABV9R3L6_9MICO|nr:multicopper oxidase [Agromyces aurantiacus]MBM7503051.1 FtsP/CotA-like multicopper oxidase with cupredoxin domain [Agromyces aurantiacus]